MRVILKPRLCGTTREHDASLLVQGISALRLWDEAPLNYSQVLSLETAFEAALREVEEEFRPRWVTQGARLPGVRCWRLLYFSVCM